jgi:hypothetical protein
VRTIRCTRLHAYETRANRGREVHRHGLGYNEVMPESEDDAFRSFLAELAYGTRWQLIRAHGWEDFAGRLADLIVDLPARRRQALVMLLFALSERMITPDDANTWISAHDLNHDEGVEEMIAWLRLLDPPDQ